MTRSRTELINRGRLVWAGGVLVLALWLATAVASPAQTFKVLNSFDGTDGAKPDAGVVQGRDGNYYGTTFAGGNENCTIEGTVTGCGTIFKISPTGTLTTLYSFTGGTDGGGPVGLTLAPDGNFYGVASDGELNGYGPGSVFKITRTGALTTLYTFCSQTGCADGELPEAGLVQGTDGNFYGTTAWGGANARNNCYGYGCGTVFKMTPAGALTTLYSFCMQAGCPDGFDPNGLVQGRDGNFYGTTNGGFSGPSYGTVFKINPSGVLTTLYTFCTQTNCPDGYLPNGLVQATDGNFYGTTFGGGAGSCFEYTWIVGCGTVFKITATGKLTTLYSFCTPTSCPDAGGYPAAGLVQATDGNFYGTTNGENYGTIFQITRAGELTMLHSFGFESDGAFPSGQLLQATNGNLYGTTQEVGTNGYGTVYSLSMGLGPFVAFVRDSGKVGWNAEILGQGFTGTTSVSFNGMPAAGFTVKRDTYLRATVPAGATTGFVTVTTPSGTLTSNVVYRVFPQIISFNPTSGPVGTPVTITGVSLTQTKKVLFGGVPATDFTVNSDTQVTATVPTGAKTGKIAIVTTGGRTWSTQDFTVTQ